MSDLQRAEYYSERGLLTESESLFKKILTKTTNNPSAVLGLHAHYKRSGDDDQALTFIDSVNAIAPQPIYSRILAQSYYSRGQYHKSLDSWRSYADQLGPDHKSWSRADGLAKKMKVLVDMVDNPLPLDLSALPDAINSIDHDEYHPQFSADGSSLVFTRKVGNQEDLYTASVDGQEYSVAPLSNINTKYNEGAHTITADGKMLVFTHCNNNFGKGSCDLYGVVKEDGKWKKPKNLSKPISTRHWEAQPSISADGSVLFFASTRPGGFGGSDIWYSVWGDDGWQDPINAGDKINTKKDEFSPFLHADGVTLYFASEGHWGFGGSDLFVSRLSGDIWSDPLNVGYPLNDMTDQRGLVVSLDGSHGYYSSSDSSGVDIYSFMMPTSLRPQPMTFVKYHIVSSVDKSPLSADVVLLNAASDTIINERVDGDFLAALPVGSDLSILVSKNGYSFYSARASFDRSAEYHAPVVDTIVLEPLYDDDDSSVESAPIVLNNVFFTSGSADLLPESASEIDFLFTFLKKHPNHIKIVGHTDDRGDADDNLSLSRLRADAVRDALIEKGIDGNRITTLGKGENEPIADNSTDAGRAKNRRTEFIIIKKHG